MAAHVWSQLVVFLLFAVCVTPNLSHPDYYTYTVINPLSKETSTQFDDVDLLSNIRLRRDVAIMNNGSETVTPASTEHNSTGSASTEHNSASSMSTTTSNAKAASPQLKLKTEIDVSNSTPKASLNITAGKNTQIQLNHNLGENGTGIWHHKDAVSTPPATNFTNTKDTIYVSDPIDPDKETSSLPDYDSGEIFESEKKFFNEHNDTEFKQDFHEYYNSTLITSKAVFDEYWKEMMKSGELIHNHVLSTSHRRAATRNLSFEFPFYGYNVNNVTIATGGFLFIGDQIHKWLAATQYIAPLMANFDTSLGKDSYVSYINNGTSFTVIWENVTLQGKHNDKFTFATTLQANGDIIFAYKNIPLPISSIQSDDHPVKVGMSDAFVVHRNFFWTNRKTIYEYHRVDFRNQSITNNTLVYFTALPTCLQYNSCTSCLEHQTAFVCTWCPNVNRCSHGSDRHRQSWIVKNCDDTKITNVTQCSASPQLTNGTDKNVAVTVNNKVEHEKSNFSHQDNESKSTALAFIMTAMIIIVVIAAWIFYAYRNPHTYSGQLLIKYRPSQWGWRRGEARYTAATIHM